MSDKLRLLLIYFIELENRPRAYKQIHCLQDFFDITEVAFAPSGRSKHFFKVTNIPRESWTWRQKIHWIANMFCGNHKPYLKRYAVPEMVELKRQKFDLVIAHNIEPCPLAFELAASAPVIIDLHEYLPGVSRTYKWRLFFRRAVHNLCAEYLPQAAAILTVSEGVADEYRKVFDVESIVNYNAPFFEDLSPSAVDEKRIEFVHHGVASPIRHTEQFFSLLDMLDDRFRLHFYLIGEGRYYESIKARAIAHPKIIWHDPVPMTQIAKTINQYDIGVSLLSFHILNHNLTISNKLFEFIQARLMVAIWPTASMNNIVHKYKVGIITDQPDVRQMADALNALTSSDIEEFKRNSHAAASVLTGEASMEAILKVIRGVLPELISDTSSRCVA